MEGPRSRAVGAGDTESITGGEPDIHMEPRTVPHRPGVQQFVPSVDLVDIRAIISQPIRSCVNVTKAGASCRRLDPPICHNTVYPHGGGCKQAGGGVPDPAAHARGVGEQQAEGCVHGHREVDSELAGACLLCPCIDEYPRPTCVHVGFCGSILGADGVSDGCDAIAPPSRD